MVKMTIEDVNVAGKRVLVRVDYNVPLTPEGAVADDKRIVASLPTVKYLLEHGAKLILCSHLGRPKGEPKPAFSLKPVAQRLAELLPGVRIDFAVDCIGREPQEKAKALKEGEILLLENLRFHKEEEKNDPAFAKELASLAELYVSDAFGTVHRAHASTVGVAAYLPAVAGFLIGKELAVMGEALDNPVRPFTAILGGAKVADKIAVIENLLQKCDSLIIGGGMAFTFLAAEGYGVGNSLLDKDSLGLAKDIMTKAKSRGVKFLLPVDVEIAKAFEAEAEHKTVQANKIPEGWMGMDIGPESAKLFAQEVINAKTVIWNGPMGVFEFPAFAKGTAAVAEACANCRGTTIIGGGDSASAVKKLGYASQMTHISTGGGASLEFLEGKVLPGVAALNDK
ncbi:MAG: phosphoglycerate kinase [Candidatus Pelethousia sp.]|nr:phosphoglycerate kinase [Candidatus Pelethousia sp.]